MKWRDLKNDPPIGDRPVIIFPSISDVGHLYQISNPEYARRTALNEGYLYWAEITPHPDHDFYEANRPKD